MKTPQAMLNGDMNWSQLSKQFMITISGLCVGCGSTVETEGIDNNQLRQTRELIRTVNAEAGTCTHCDSIIHELENEQLNTTEDPMHRRRKKLVGK